MFFWKQYAAYVCGKERSSDNVYKGNLQEIKTQAAQNDGSLHNTAEWTGRDMEEDKNI